MTEEREGGMRKEGKEEREQGGRRKIDESKEKKEKVM